MLNGVKAILESQREILRLYALGALLFFVGLGLIQWADKLIEPSLEQETYALLGTAVGGLGFLTAMFAQVLLIVSRFQNLGRRKP
jgi:uncharacterized membrane protein YcjF (UPF0283 family)